jgi:hypothetical protein
MHVPRGSEFILSRYFLPAILFDSVLAGTPVFWREETGMNIWREIFFCDFGEVSYEVSLAPNPIESGSIRMHRMQPTTTTQHLITSKSMALATFRKANLQYQQLIFFHQ